MLAEFSRRVGANVCSGRLRSLACLDQFFRSAKFSRLFSLDSLLANVIQKRPYAHRGSSPALNARKHAARLGIRSQGRKMLQCCTFHPQDDNLPVILHHRRIE